MTCFSPLAEQHLPVRLSTLTSSMTGSNKTEFTSSELTCVLKTSILINSSYTDTYAYFNNCIKHFVV